MKFVDVFKDIVGNTVGKFRDLTSSEKKRRRSNNMQDDHADHQSVGEQPKKPRVAAQVSHTAAPAAPAAMPYGE